MNILTDLKRELLNVDDVKSLTIGNMELVRYTNHQRSSQFQVQSKEAFFLHVLEGEKVINSSTQCLSLKAGDSAIVTAGSMIMNEFSASEEKPFRSCLLFFEKSFLQKLLKDSFYQDYFRRESTKRQGELLKVELSLSSFFEKLLQTDYTELSQRTMELKLHQLLSAMFEAEDSQECVHFFKGFIEAQKTTLEDIIETHKYSSKTLADFAFLSSRSLSSFKRDFQAIYHESPKQWILKEKLSRACLLLRNKNLQVSEVATLCGFSSAIQFSRTFRQKYGVPPSEFK